ncbi:MAG: phosphotriesterase [Kurthia sp.]|nr:phosphotriesterase [Candidatus Kurthia equi]
MTYVNTISGKIDVNDLGLTLVHEHLIIRSEIIKDQFPHLYDEENLYKKALDAVKSVQKQGVKTICDPTIAGMGRDVKFLERIANETGIQIVTATGYYSFNEIPMHFQTHDIDYLAEAFIRDIEVGIQNTTIKAGFLKCATEDQGVTPDVEKVLRAVARAQKRTGVPIMTHSHPASENGLKQLEIFLEEGVNPKAIMIGHSGDTTDLTYIQKLLDSGAFIGMDRYGQGPLPYPERNETLLKVLKQGNTNRVFLSQDYCCSIDWYPDEMVKEMLPEWSMTFLLDEVIPTLQKEGITDEQIHTIMYDNVQNWFGYK